MHDMYMRMQNRTPLPSLYQTLSSIFAINHKKKKEEKLSELVPLRTRVVTVA